MSEKIFCLQPNYLRDFKCDGAACGAACCRGAWNIFVDAKTYEKYSALPRAEKILRHLRADADGKFLIAHDEDGCPFLGADNLCRLQKAYGENYLSPVCAGYPRIITRCENFLEVALSPTCPLAAKLVLTREPLRFEVAQADEKILRLGASNILRGVPHDLAPLIFDVQLAMVSILQQRRLSLDGRLIVSGFFLDRIEELLCGGRLDGAAVKRLAEIYTSEKFFATEVPLMLSCVRFDATAHENFLREIFVALEFNGELCDARPLPDEFATLAENFLVNEILLSAWPFRVDASIVNNFGVFATVYKIFERRACGARTVDEIFCAAGDVSRKIDHADDCAEKISSRLGDDLLRIMDKLLRGG